MSTLFFDCLTRFAHSKLILSYSRFSSDVALIELPISEAHSEYIHTARLSCTPTPIATSAVTMGFGRINTTIFLFFATILQYTKLKTIDAEECVSNIQDLHNFTDAKNGLICASGSKTSLCSGDKGAPLVAIKTGELIGIASYADANCTLGSPHGFTRIRPYIQWIEGVIDEYICKKQISHWIVLPPRTHLEINDIDLF